MSFSQFKVPTFDVVGTLIDFETGVLDAVRAIGGEAAAGLDMPVARALGYSICWIERRQGLTGWGWGTTVPFETALR